MIERIDESRLRDNFREKGLDEDEIEEKVTEVLESNRDRYKSAPAYKKQSVDGDFDAVGPPGNKMTWEEMKKVMAQYRNRNDS